MAGSGASLEISSRTSVGSPAGTWQRPWAGWERWATTKRPDAVTPWAWRSQVHFSGLSPAEIMVWATIVAMPAPLRMRRAREEQRCDRADAM